MRPPRQGTGFLTGSTREVLVRIELSDLCCMPNHCCRWGMEGNSDWWDWVSSPCSCDWGTRKDCPVIDNLPRPLKLWKGISRGRDTRPINKNDLLYRTSQFPKSLPCFIILFFSLEDCLLSVFLTCDTFSSTVVFYLEFTNYLIRIKGPLNLSPICKFKWWTLKGFLGNVSKGNNWIW